MNNILDYFKFKQVKFDTNFCQRFNYLHVTYLSFTIKTAQIKHFEIGYFWGRPVYKKI